MSRYLVSIKKIKNKEIRNLFKKYSVRKLQRIINKLFDKHLTEDDIFGNITLYTVNHLNQDQVKLLLEYFKEGKKATKKCPYNYVKIAKEELGVTEIRGAGSNKRIEQYHRVAGGYHWKDDVPWCASFISFIMVKAGYHNLPKYPFRAKSWLNFGVSVGKPYYGSLAIKSRKGGGHIGIVLGISSDERYLYILGGNQNDKVCIKKYRKSVFIDFRMPNDNCEKRLVYTTYANATKAGKEV